MTTRTTLDKRMTEDELLQAITEAATLYGWKWHHVRRSDKALQMGDPGFPDLVLARNGRVMFLELKARGGRVTEGQKAWMNVLWSPNVDVGWVWPDDLDTILRLLK